MCIKVTEVFCKQTSGPAFRSTDVFVVSVLFGNGLKFGNSLHIAACSHNGLKCTLRSQLTRFRSRTLSSILINEYKYTMSSNVLNQAERVKCECAYLICEVLNNKSFIGHPRLLKKCTRLQMRVIQLLSPRVIRTFRHLIRERVSKLICFFFF